MSSQRTPRHRVAPKPARTPSGTGTAATSQRVTMIAAGAVFCALLVLALVTLPKHRQPDAAAGNTTVADDSARYLPVGDPSTLAPPASVTRDLRRQPATFGALPQLGQGPASSSHGPGSPSATSTAPGGPAGASGSGADPGSSGGPAPAGTRGPTAAGALPDPAQVAQAVFDAINSSRHGAGLRPLKWNAGLQASAQRHNQAMANSNTLSHQVPGEAGLGDRETNAGVFWWWAAENIGYSSSLTEQAALDLESAMVNEQPPNDGHRQNILSGRAQAVGIDVHFDTTHHRLWLTEDFAQTSLL